MSAGDRAKLKTDAGIPHMPTALTYDLRLAVAGEGPRAFEWTDKPHRLLYDACREIEALADRLEAREGWVMVPREPTEAMQQALTDLGRATVPDEHERDQWTWFAVKAYRAMLSSLPPAPEGT
jgi:hypothetical protein